MRNFIFAFSLFIIIAGVMVQPSAQAQTFYMDPGTQPIPLYCRMDSCSSTDSSFAQFTPPVGMYYRGLTVVSKSGGAATFRFVRISSPATAIDSCAVTASAIYANTAFTSARAGAVHQLLVAGVPYRLEYISTLNQAFIKPSAVLWFTLN